ncbi:MAG: ABC transporter substrate-binding protein, partial [Bacillota bacterium]|nr:ABC transporter substrate-binding protein [Bacillota bacterium]
RGGGLFGAATVTVTDDAARQVAVPKRVQRVVSLAPSATEILYAVGAGGQVVGVDAYSNFPAAALDVAKVGDYAQISMESVVALKPDVVLASSLHGAQLAQMEQLGLKVLFVEPRNMEGVYKDIELVGKVTGHEAEAGRVISDMKAQLAAVASKLAGLSAEERPVVYYEVWADPLMSAGPKTYTHEVIQLAGGNNLAHDAEVDYPILTSELIVARNPAVIVWPTFHGAEQLTPARLSERPGWGSISAIKGGRVHSIDADIISRGGPRLADAVVEMAKLLHPERFR